MIKTCRLILNSHKSVNQDPMCSEGKLDVITNNMLFLSSSNDKGAQLIFNTHDISLLEKDLFRRDQIWFTEKSNNGNSELYCLQDFEGLREDIPFEKWYMAGKFGALPDIDHIDNIFKK